MAELSKEQKAELQWNIEVSLSLSGGDQQRLANHLIAVLGHVEMAVNQSESLTKQQLTELFVPLFNEAVTGMEDDPVKYSPAVENAVARYIASTNSVKH